MQGTVCTSVPQPLHLNVAVLRARIGLVKGKWGGKGGGSKGKYGEINGEVWVAVRAHLGIKRYTQIGMRKPTQ